MQTLATRGDGLDVANCEDCGSEGKGIAELVRRSQSSEDYLGQDNVFSRRQRTTGKLDSLKCCVTPVLERVV